MRVTEPVIEVEPLEPAALKGKAERVALWRALRARTRFGVDVEPAARTPLVGREHDLGLLRETYLRTLRESSIQLVTISGEAGVGKTRLVTELRGFVDDQSELVFWRQGRCLPYGEGITFWALGEIVKAQAGVLESDGQEDAACKLEVALEATGAGDDEWLRAKLAPLIGLAGAEGGRDEAYVAWRRFLESLAAERPLVLVFEDLHWADAALLDFIEHLVDWSSDVPILVLCTARPELYERAPGWGGGKRNSTTTTLGPLTNDETARLLAALFSRAVLPAETQTALLERAGGNPLYAEQFARMLGERAGGDIAVPETVQALIAARLDTLAPERKSLLQEAAVVGKVFWAGEVAAMSGLATHDVQESLRDLVRRELIRPARLSTIEGEQEFSFWHLLVRDVAYQQIPRAARARKHLAAAEWIARIAGERIADHAEILVHHYEQALDLARAAGESDEARRLEEPLRRFLLTAAERARHLDAAKAYEHTRRALELVPKGHPERGDVLLAVADNALAVAHLDEAESYSREALPLFESKGDRRRTGAILSNLAHITFGRGNRAAVNELVARSLEILEGEPPSPELALAYMRKAGSDMLMGNSEACLVSSERALALAREVGTREYEPMALQARGGARLELGDPDGVDDLCEGVRVAIDAGLGRTAAIAYNNLSDYTWLFEGLHEALRIKETAIEFGNARGMENATLWARGERPWLLFDLGAWDELLREAELVLARDRERGVTQVSLFVYPQKALVLVLRGRAVEAAELMPEFLPQAHAAADPQVLVPALAASAVIRHAVGDVRGALDLVRELEAFTRDRPSWNRVWYAPDAVRMCVAAGDLELGERFVDGDDVFGVRPHNSLLTVRAILAEARDETNRAAELYDEAAGRWQEYGHRLEHAQALLGLGRTRPDAEAVRRAREILTELGAVALLESTDGLPQTATVAPAGPEAARRVK
jgi:tetratricopeptide (TPR) repeat protein